MKRIHLTILCLFVLSANAFAFSEADIVLFAQVEMKKDSYTLSDIAEIKSDDAGLFSFLKKMQVGSTMRRGYTHVYNQAEIKRLVNKKLKSNDIKLNWLGSEKIRIKSLGQEISFAKYIEAADRYLNDYLLSHDDGLSKFKTKVLSHKVQGFIPFGLISHSFKISANGSVNKRMNVWLELAVNGKKVSAIPVWFDVEAVRPIYVLKKPLPMRSVLRESDFDLVYRDTANLRNEVAVLSDINEEAMLVSNKPEGSVLMKYDVKKIPAVRKDERVEVNVASNGVLIKTFAVAESDADIGEWVKLKNRDGLLYSAKVAAMGVAEIN